MSVSKLELDKLVEKYETVEFFYDDPIGIPNRFKDKRDKEIAGFISSLVAYGRRDVFIKKLNELFDIADNEPYNFIINFEPKILGNFNYRFGKSEDFAQIFNILKGLYKNDGGLEELFKYAYKNKVDNNMFIPVSDYFYSRARDNSSLGFKFMIPDARKSSAMKRMCMFLRWMVRKGPVDFGIWNFMDTSELLMPLDVHVARISRQMGLLERKINDFKAVLELTENLKKFDNKDPVKYDFAIFGLGVNG
ncbi:TIGR02757 family protein [bacterium]|nr:TIGR02757 family protein [bacterium]